MIIEVEPQVAANLRGEHSVPLSDAILNGCALTEPLMQSYYEFDNDDKPHACALGAALYSMGWRQWMEEPDIAVTRMFPVLGLEEENPTNETDRCELQGIIISLNDNRRWTRERIAAWLKTIGL